MSAVRLAQKYTGKNKVLKFEKIVLIFGEVITGFRIFYGGVQKLFDVNPDLICLGKIVGEIKPKWTKKNVSAVDYVTRHVLKERFVHIKKLVN